jgi:hypothetical protein
VPPLIRRYIKTNFVFLIAGLVLGGGIVVSEFVAGIYPPQLFVTAPVHLPLVETPSGEARSMRAGILNPW